MEIVVIIHVPGDCRNQRNKHIEVKWRRNAIREESDQWIKFHLNSYVHTRVILMSLLSPVGETRSHAERRLRTFSPRGELDTRVVMFLPFIPRRGASRRLPRFSDVATHRARNHAIPLSVGSEITIAWKARIRGQRENGLSVSSSRVAVW